MLRDEFGHLEHAHLALAIKYRPERVVGVDHDSFLFVLQTALLDVCPKLFCKLLACESGVEPTTAESLSSGCTGFMKAGFGLRLEVFLVFGMDAD